MTKCCTLIVQVPRYVRFVEVKITVYEFLRARQVTDHKFLEGKIESLTMRKGYSS